MSDSRPCRPLLIDMHADTPQRFADEGWNFSDPLGAGHVNLQTARQGGLSAEFFALWVEPVQWRGHCAHRTLQLLDAVYQQLRMHPNTMRLALTPGDIVAAHRDEVFSVLLGIEGGHSIENDLGLLRMFYRLGVRYMTLTWSNTNEWADSSGDLAAPGVEHHDGLTEFGRDVVREMNRLGMMVDVSHVADSTFRDVLATTSAPVIASHSNARDLASSPRNLTDDQLRAIADNGGVAMVNFYPGFLSNDWSSAWAATQTERNALYEAAAAKYRNRGEPVPYNVPLSVDRRFFTERFTARDKLPSLDAVLDHFAHMIDMAGVDHVGFGSDFDGFPLLPRGLSSAADLPKIPEGLKTRGYGTEALEKLLAGNVLRVMSAAQGTAKA